MSAPNTVDLSSPLGASVTDGGVNFSLFSRTASGVELLLFDRADDPQPARALRLDPVTNHTYHYWHLFLPGVRPGQLYGYRVEGPSASERGLRFDAGKVLLDPYGRGVVVPKSYDREAAKRAGNTSATAMKNVVVDPRGYDWEGDAPLCLPSSRTVICEMQLPSMSGYSWRRWIDTGLDSPHDIVPAHKAPAVSGKTYRAEPRSVVVLVTGGKE